MPTQMKRKSAPASASRTPSYRPAALVAFEQLIEAGLVDRQLASEQRLDPLGQHVTDGDVVPELREARAGDEADVAGAEKLRFWTRVEA